MSRSIELLSIWLSYLLIGIGYLTGGMQGLLFGFAFVGILWFEYYKNTESSFFCSLKRRIESRLRKKIMGFSFQLFIPLYLAINFGQQNYLELAWLLSRLPMLLLNQAIDDFLFTFAAQYYYLYAFI